MIYGRRRVPTVDGDKTLTVREGTQSGDRLRMRGYGVPTLGGRGRGDQYVHVKCVSGSGACQSRSFVAESAYVGVCAA